MYMNVYGTLIFIMYVHYIQYVTSTTLFVRSIEKLHLKEISRLFTEL